MSRLNNLNNPSGKGQILGAAAYVTIMIAAKMMFAKFWWG